MPHYFIFLLVALGLALIIPKDLRDSAVGRLTTADVMLCHLASVSKTGADSREDDEFKRHFCRGPSVLGDPQSLPDKEQP